MRWEYKRVSFDIADVPQVAFEIELNRLGVDGWELISSLKHERHGYSHEVYLVFKRVVAVVDEDARAAE